MIDLYYAPTPNGWKISIMLEELGVPYTIVPVNIRAGDQFKPDFLAISPNNRIPAIVDHAPAGGGEPFWVFDPFDRQIREGAVRRGSTKEYVRAGREGDGGAEMRSPSFPDVQLHIVDAPLGAGPESITTIGSMDSGLALRAPRNDE